MPKNSFGTALTITTFGESHGPAIGVTIDGLQSNFTIDLDDLSYQMSRRRPGGNRLGTKREESDAPEIVSGVFEGKTTGTPLTMIIRNTNQRSSDYAAIKDIYRPGHADYTWDAKFGLRDYRGGGRSSGRETAARVAAGAIARQILASYGITIEAYAIQIGSIVAQKRDYEQIKQNLVSCPDKQAAQEMEALIERMRQEGNSVGGIIECRIKGVPAGLGEPVFDKTDALLAHAMLSVGAVKGIEFGLGFASASMTGLEHNDQMDASGFLSNHAGGINGGITNGEPIVFRCAIKPTSSISLAQKSVDSNNQEHSLVVEGRHDPSICVRIVPVIEAMAAITLLSLWYEQHGR